MVSIMDTGGKQGEEENVEKFFMLAVGLDGQEGRKGPASPIFWIANVFSTKVCVGCS